MVASVDDLTRFFAANKGDLSTAIARAKEQLELCRAECRELEERIRAAEAALAIGGRMDRPSTEPTLRAAMIAVLRGESNGLTAPEIARRIEQRGLYRRPNGQPVDIGQIHNRVHHYPAEFARGDGRIRSVG